MGNLRLKGLNIWPKSHKQLLMSQDVTKVCLSLNPGSNLWALLPVLVKTSLEPHLLIPNQSSSCHVTSLCQKYAQKGFT